MDLTKPAHLFQRHIHERLRCLALASKDDARSKRTGATVIRNEIEHMRRQILRQRKEILTLRRAGIPTKSAEELLERMQGKVDGLCAERVTGKLANSAKNIPAPTVIAIAVPETQKPIKEMDYLAPSNLRSEWWRIRHHLWLRWTEASTGSIAYI